MSEAKSVAQILSEAIRKQGFRTIQEAAKATGLSYKTLRGAINGDTNPTPQTLMRLAGRLGVDADSLLRSALRRTAVGEKFLPQHRFFDEWDTVAARARALGEEVERDLIARCDWYLRGAEARAREESHDSPSSKGRKSRP